MPHIYFSPEVKDFLLLNPKQYDGMVDIACSICDNNYMRFFENDISKFTCEGCW
jgi:hypothetical protein